MKPADIALSVAGLLLVLGREWIAKALGPGLMGVSILSSFFGFVLAARGLFLGLFAALAARDRSRAGQPPAPPRPGVILVACPRCRQPSDSIKRYGMMGHIVFLVLFIQAQRVDHTACPRCMRQAIGDNMVSIPNVLGGNILWPIAVLLPGLIQLPMTFIPGHSRSVRKALEASTASTT